MRIINNALRSTLHAQLPTLMVACTLLFAACHDEQAAGNDSDPRAITAQSAHQPMNGEQSRAAFVGNISNSNPLLSRVITFNGESVKALLADDAGKVWCDGSFLFTARGATTAYDPGAPMTTGTGSYPAEEEETYDTYYLTGLHPNDNWTGEVASTSSTLTHAITGKDDIMTTSMQTVAKADIANRQSPTLTFRHRLTKFEVQVKAKDATVAAMWNKLTSIQLVDLKAYPTLPNTFGYTLDGSAESYTDEGEKDTPLDFYTINHSGAKAVYLDAVYAGTGNIPTNDDGLSAAYTLAPPFVPTDNDDVTIRVVAETSKGEVRTLTMSLCIPTLPGDATTAGYAYRMLISFVDAEKITAAAEVIDWMNNENNIDLEVEEIRPPIYEVETPANCYIVNEHTTRGDTLIISTRQAIEGWKWMETNGDVGVDSEGNRYSETLETLLTDTAQWSVELLWCTWDNFPEAGFTFSHFNNDLRLVYRGGTAKVKDKVVIVKGMDKVPTGHNAVIALKDNDGNIWWSWHLWFTTYTPTKTDATNGQVHTYASAAFKAGGLYEHSVMMDRDLGCMRLGTINAIPEYPECNEWSGMLYQWGRKDLFMPSTTGNPSTPSFVPNYDAGGSPKSSDASPGGSNCLVDAIRMPHTFFTSATDWTAQNDNLWGGDTITDKTPFDPCPAGWRVPKGGTTATDNPWNGFSGNFTGDYYGRLYTGVNKDGTIVNVNAYYPPAQGRTGSGGVGNFNTHIFWSSAISAANAHCLNATNPTGATARACGYPVRCVSDPDDN